MGTRNNVVQLMPGLRRARTSASARGCPAHTQVASFRPYERGIPLRMPLPHFCALLLCIVVGIVLIFIPTKHAHAMTLPMSSSTKTMAILYAFDPSPTPANSQSITVVNEGPPSVTTANVGWSITSMQVGLVTGAALLLGGVLLLGMFLLQKHARLAHQADSHLQANGYQPSHIRSTPPATYPVVLPGLNAIQKKPSIPTVSHNPSLTSQTQVLPTRRTPNSLGFIREHKPPYQVGTTKQGKAEHIPETPIPSQETMNQIDPLLKAMMRQAQMGLFALPDKKEHSQDREK